MAEDGKSVDKEESDIGAEIDDELKGLLGEAQGPLPGDDSKPVSDELDEDDEDECMLIKPEQPDEVVDVIDNENQSVDVKSLVDRFKDVADDILKNFLEDRHEIEGTINELRNHFMQSTKPKAFIVEGLVSALRTKADTNANAIKILDTYAKLISATKNMEIGQNTFVNLDLSKLLEDDDE